MRIYSVADIHGKRARVARIRQTVKKHRPDILVIAGDISHLAGAAGVVKALDRLGVPVLAVRGNMDLRRVDTLLARGVNTACLHLKEVEIGGIRFVGVGGTTLLPFRTRIAWREKRIMSRLQNLVTEKSVLVAHPPPWGTLDAVAGGLHAGSRALRKLIPACRPRLLLCGHIHERPGFTMLDQTLVVNCNLAHGRRGALVTIEKNHPPLVQML